MLFRRDQTTENLARDFVPNQQRETVPHAGLNDEWIKARRTPLF
jgi:hypothetical protein